MKKITAPCLIMLLGFIMYSCGSSIPLSDATHEAWAKKRWSNIDLSVSRELYVTNCSGCHRLHSPKEYTMGEWGVIFSEMSVKAHMSEQDSISVIAYLLTYSKNNDLRSQ